MKIDKGIPIPKEGQSRVRKHYPFDQMEVGDSFAVSADGDELTAVRMRVSGAISRLYPYLERDKKFTVRTIREKNEVRVWRIE